MKTFTTLLGGLCLLLSGLLTAARAQCPAPVPVSVTSPAPGALSVNFPSVPQATAYVVRYFWAGDSSAAGVRRQRVTAAPVVLTGLRASAYYVVSVGSICSPGDTAYSPTQLVYTDPLPPTAACAAVANLQVSALSSASATVSFSPSAAALSYTVRYSWGSGQSASFTSPSTTARLNLQPSTSYTVAVRANCPGGTSAWATTSLQTPAAPPAPPCGAPTNVTVTATSDSTASVSFTPGLNNTSFLVTYHLANDSARSVMATASPVTLAGLVPGQTYYIQVLGFCGSGNNTVYANGPALTFGFRGTSVLNARGQLGAGRLVLYPNPARQTVQLEVPAVPGAATARVTLLNTLGQEVGTRQVALTAARNRTQLALAGLKPGLYTVRVSAGSHSATQRLVVEP